MPIYLAGPMRGIDGFNFEAFHGAAAHLRSLGYTVISPAEHDLELGFDPEKNSLEDFDLTASILWDLEQVAQATTIVVLPGWEVSSGVAAEVALARFLGTPVLEYPGLRPIATTSEVRLTDPETGGQKGTKLARYDLIPPDALHQLAEHYGYGATKYEDRNWEKGYRWSLSFAALQRHAWAFWRGEDIDPDSGRAHLAAVMFHAAALLTFAETHPEKDDRCAR